ncbi:MAG: hypothetical protein K6G86_07815 [Bacteroidales bacterium]|nr:hypothetical protein [Bacteroidales bacterium]
MIKYFETEAAYLAATKSPFESEISLVGADNNVHFDGRNVVVDIRAALTGSICVLDGHSAMHFIALGTFSSTSFMSQFTPIGVVAVGIDHPDFRGQIVIAHKTDAAKVWSYIYSYKLTGYTLDGTDRTGKLNIYEASDSWAARHSYTISYNAETAAALVEQLNTYFQANAPFTTQDWVASADDQGNISLQFHFVSGNQRSNTGSNGFALTANLLPEITATDTMLRRNGYRSGGGTIMNMPRAIAYFTPDLNNASYNPTSNVTTTKLSVPICKPAYLGTSSYRKDGDTQLDYCSALRAVYGEGEAGWLKFMESFLPVKPTTYGAVGNKATYGDGKTNTYKMAGKTFTGQNGTAVPAFPAADFCASITYNHVLAARGQWMLPDVDTLFSIMKGIKYNTTNNRNADPVNAALYAIGGNAISNGANAWSSSRYFAGGAWYFYGNYGCAGNGGMYNSYRALPVLLLDVRDLLADA